MRPSARPESPLRLIASDWRFYRTAEGVGGALQPLREAGFWIMATHRMGYWARGVRMPLLGGTLRLLYCLKRFFLFACFGADIRSSVEIGRRCWIHTTQGIVIADGVRIGDDCILYSGVGIVNRANDKGDGVPMIGHRVRIGTGAKLMGGIHIGDDARIGANAVVLCDVPAGCMAVGVPAVIKPRPASGGESPDSAPAG